VIGGGEVAARKVDSLLEAGAEVTLVSPSLGPAMKLLVARGRVTLIERAYRSGDLNGCELAYAATDDPELHRQIAAEAKALGILINVADEPELCSFIAPAIVKQGALQIAISTGGASPAFAARLRRELEDKFGIEYSRVLEVLRAARTRLHRAAIDPEERMARLKALADSSLLDAIAAGDRDTVERILVAHLGDGATIAALGLDAQQLGLSARTAVTN
ncbi:MAG TPA: bifunctional precorrin-2 dehydrogenase/sirohydrochlorin ferrochelatase, partial [Candidatus Acidoferrales bacterium]|nr:bifunctional precorrin-2 dehydrogenase/sirohydrochlorin ferrochelatase [Candidatus Acidoferrales bacterium]